MPRFFFDVLEDGEVTPDNGGLEFDSPDAAERNEDGDQVLSAAVPMTVRRLEFAQA
jgi:hypothetical protein